MEGNFWAGMEGCPGAHGTATVDNGPSAVGRAVRPLGDRRDPTFNLFTRARVPYPAPRQPGCCLSISTSTSLLSIVIVRVGLIAIWRTTAQKLTYLFSNLSSSQHILMFPPVPR